VHETGPAGYPFAAQASFRQENFDIRTTDKNMKQVGIQSWITDTKARELFAAAGQDFDALKKAALSKDFKPMPLKAKANITIKIALELAEAFTRLPTPPKRSILFLAVTAEEKLLLGAKYYATNPLHPLDQTLADINMDGINQWGRTKDVVVIGYGNSTLDDILTQAASEQGRAWKPDAEPEKGFFYRSDHFEFAKQGVLALDPVSSSSENPPTTE
jgi:Zn-dependent M28 family amino/carboxypeptidase